MAGCFLGLHLSPRWSKGIRRFSCGGLPSSGPRPLPFIHLTTARPPLGREHPCKLKPGAWQHLWRLCPALTTFAGATQRGNDDMADGDLPVARKCFTACFQRR